MEVIFGFVLFVLFTCLMAFSVWGALYVAFLIMGIVLVVVIGILKNRRLSESVNGDLDTETKDVLALVMSVAIVGIAISIGSWTPVEVGMCLGAVIFYLQIWIQTGGTLSLPFRRNKVLGDKDATYKLTDLGKPMGEMSLEERRMAAEKIVETILDQAKTQEKSDNNSN